MHIIKGKELEEVHGAHCFVSAPGGCGKTNLLARRVCYAIEKLHINPSDMLCVTFSKAAADEMVSRINKRLKNKKIRSYLNEDYTRVETDEDVLNINVSTLHSVCIKLLINASWEQNFSYLVMDDEDTRSLINEAIRNVLDSHRKTKYNWKVHKDDPLRIICGSNSSLIKQYYEAILKVHHTIRQQELGMISDEDNRLQLYKGFSRDSAKGVIKRELSLISEFAEELSRLKGLQPVGGTMFVEKVDFDDILCLAWEKLHTGAIGPQYDWIQVDEVQDMTPLQVDIIKKLTKKTGKETVIFFGDKYQAIYGFMGSGINVFEDLLAETPTENQYRLKYNYRSVKPLINFQKEFLEREFHERKMLPSFPSSLKKHSKKFYEFEKPIEIRYFPTDKKQETYICEEAIRLSKIYKDASIAILCRHRRECKTYFSLISKMAQNGAYLDLYPFYMDTCSEIDVIKELKKVVDDRFQNDYPEEDDKIYWLKTLNSIASIALRPNYFIKSFLEYIKLIQDRFPDRDSDFYFRKIFKSSVDDIYRLTGKNSGIIISTVHKAKGMGFDIVFVPSVIEGNYPSFDAVTKKDEMEDARLLYVAISRASSKLVLSHFGNGLVREIETHKQNLEKQKEKNSKETDSRKRNPYKNYAYALTQTVYHKKTVKRSPFLPPAEDNSEK